MWTRNTDPLRAKDNLKEHWIHKDLWKTLRLTSDAENKEEPPGDAEDHCGEVQQAGAGHGVRKPGADGRHDGGDCKSSCKTERIFGS